MRRAAMIATFALAIELFVSAHAWADCSITTTGVNFGAYDVFATTAVDSTGSVRYQCTGNTPGLAITISQGASGTFQPRKMMFGAEGLAYNLYLDAGRTSIWGDGTSGTSMFAVSSPSGKPATVTIFGRIPAGQDVAAGSYGDSVVVTIQF